MEENNIWTGTPSHWLNFGWYFILLLFIIVPFAISPWFEYWWYLFAIPALILPFAAARWFKTKFTKYSVSNQRIIISTGVFTRKTQELELYRVKDYSIVSPFSLRLVRRGILVMNTSDRSTPVVTLQAIPEVEKLRDEIRRSVEILRDTKRVREVDYEAGDDDDLPG